MHKVLRAILIVAFMGIGQVHGQKMQSKYWIYFTDKGPEMVTKSPAAYKSAGKRISDKALKRRAKVKSSTELLDEFDLPVYEGYLSTISERAKEIIVVSRWLNACSAFLSESDIALIEQLPFVKKVRSVHQLVVPPRESISNTALEKIAKIQEETMYDYGSSIDQITQINVHKLHNADIVGKGVLLGLLDSGFKYDKHPALIGLDIVAAYDFVFNDANTSNEDGDDPEQHDHGTQVLSVAAGFAPGQLIGPAFKSQILLAKTEDLRSETPAEEDYWVEGIEWMEAQGVDIASSSLGYSDFDDPFTDYSWSDLDGNTAIITKAAQIAVDKGVVVVTSAGNEGNKTWRYIAPPADARDAIAVGAVEKSGVRSSFSSVGSPFLSHIKPDVMAMGTGVTMVDPNSTGYTTANGTSFSAPLVAGVVAQMLGVHPELTPLQVIEALHSTASQAYSPDSLYGWGIVDAERAVTYWGPALGQIFHIEVESTNLATIAVGFLGGPEMDSTSLQIHWKLQSAPEFESEALAPMGMSQYVSPSVSLSEAELTMFYFTVQNKAGEITTFPSTAPEEIFGLDHNGRIDGYDELQLLPPNKTSSHYLYNPFPNPYIMTENTEIRFAFDLLSEAFVELTIYDVLGRRVAVVLPMKRFPTGKGAIDWTGFDEKGNRLASGVYFLVAKFRQLDGKVVIKKRKFILIK
ncbi:MAG: S8 family peptidase [Deferribacteres bacterium]|nr:S8 family peptidase [candidate division KSB1 bacterium]MCB9500983.1 S8 family peptidase [Deferribacteres bacterium]